MGMAEVETTGTVKVRGRGFWIRVGAGGAAGVLAIAGVLFGGAAYADARARDALEESRAAATDAIAVCLALVTDERAALIGGAAGVLDAAPVADRVATELNAVKDARTALRDGAAAACAQTVTDDVDSNDQAAVNAAADGAHVKDLAGQLRAAAATLADAAAAAKVDVAHESFDAARDELTKAIDAQSAAAAALVGQVADQATLDALAKAVADAKALVEVGTTATDVEGLNDATGALDDALAQLAAASTAAAGSHQAWIDAQAAAAAAGGGGGGTGSGTHSGTGTHTGGGGTGGTSGGGGSSGGGSTGGGAGIVTWTTCNGDGQDKYIDGEFTGVGRACTTVAIASAAVAPYQNPGNGTCAVVGSRTSDSTNALVSKASEYTYGRFTFTQANDYQVKMTIESCLAP